MARRFSRSLSSSQSCHMSLMIERERLKERWREPLIETVERPVTLLATERTSSNYVSNGPACMIRDMKVHCKHHKLANRFPATLKPPIGDAWWSPASTATQGIIGFM
ncbi:hypothetical protein Hdeb2414_s0005g00177171 [Helianthus debilis subsp. tardiflorus]